MPIPPYQNDVCTRKDEPQNTMTDDSDPQELLEDLESLADELISGGGYPTDKKENYPYRTGVGRGKNRAGIQLKELIAEHRGDDGE